MHLDIFMPIIVGDYLKETMHLSPEQHGIYDLLLMNYWVRGEALPDDDEYLARVAKASLCQWQTHRPVIGKFFGIADGKWVHTRTEEQLAVARRKMETKSKSGKMGASARWNGKRMAEPMADALAPRWQNDANQSQSQNHNIDIVNKADGKVSYSFRALKLANHIVSNLTGWHYDNCKVQVADLSNRSLASVIEPFLKRISDEKLIAAWHEAVRIAHGASVDGLAHNATAYAIQCFKEQAAKL